MCDQASGASRLEADEIVFGVACERCGTWHELERRPYRPRLERRRGPARARRKRVQRLRLRSRLVNLVLSAFSRD